MEKIYIGKYVKTHGIKGEIRIKSNFKYKDKVFVKGNKIYLDNKEFIINSYRVHQDYDMITLVGINNINEIIDLKGSKVYIDKSDLKLSNLEYLDEDLIGMDIYMNDNLKGKVTGIMNLSKNKKLLVINDKYVPFELIKNIDFKNKKILLEEVDGLL